MNNFYNEPAPMRELANLGTSIPNPALAQCMTAVLCVKLGNFYGTSWGAQEPADQIIGSLSKDRWLYYFNERLEQDRIVLSKLKYEKPCDNWIALVRALDIDPDMVSSRNVRALIVAAHDSDKSKLKLISNAMFEASMG